MLWAHLRGSRATHDYSHGWGSNSQWRTAARIDLQVGKQRIYNATQTDHLVLPKGKRARTEHRRKVELMRFRHAVTTPSDDEAESEMGRISKYRYVETVRD